MGYKAGMTHVVRDLDRPGSSECSVQSFLLTQCFELVLRDAQARGR